MYTTEQSDDCTISLHNETAVSYESENPYRPYDKCNAEFSCSAGRIPEYRIQRFRTEPWSYFGSCYIRDYLGLYIS